MDDAITIADASLIQKYSIGLKTCDAKLFALADVNGDGRLSIRDVTLIQKYIAGNYSNIGNVGQDVTIPE